MSVFRLCLLFMLLTLAPVNVGAQVDDLFAWEPDPAELFAPGVEILSKEYAASPSIWPNHDGRVVRVFDSATGTFDQFAYDAAITELWDSYTERRMVTAGDHLRLLRAGAARRWRVGALHRRKSRPGAGLNAALNSPPRPAQRSGEGAGG